MPCRLQHTALEHALFGLRSDCVGKQARAEDAVADAQRAAALAPTFGPGYAKLGAALQAAGRNEEAAVAWETAGTLCEGLAAEAAQAKANCARAKMLAPKRAEAEAQQKRATEKVEGANA